MITMFMTFLFVGFILFVAIETYNYYDRSNTLRKEVYYHNGLRLEQVVLNKAGVKYIRYCIDNGIYKNVFKLIIFEGNFFVRNVSLIEALEVTETIFSRNISKFAETAFITDESRENIQLFLSV